MRTAHRNLTVRWLGVTCMVACAQLLQPTALEGQATASDLSASDRIYGLSLLWSEAAYNFPYFGDRPELDWNEAYREAIPRVMSAGSTVEYYRELQRFAALLRDGHTRVELPDSIQQRHPYSSPWVDLRAIGGRPMVANVSVGLADSLPLGSEIVEVDGIALDIYLDEHVLPYVFASAPHVRRIRAIEGSHARGYGLLVGPPESMVRVGFRTRDGVLRHLTLRRDRFSGSNEWLQPPETGSRRILEFRTLPSNVAYLAINSFSDSRLLAQLDSLLPRLRSSQGIVIDLRTNGGGSDIIALDVLARFTGGPLVGTGSRVRVHDAYLRALGSFGRSTLERALPDSTGLIDRAMQHVRGEAWRLEPPDTVRPHYDGERVTSPVAVLIGPATASAAENLVAWITGVPGFIVVGSPTAGSTGQPLVFRLPGGGTAQVVTRAALLPDGTPVTREGIVPTYVVEQTLEDHLVGRDVVLDEALRHLSTAVRDGQQGQP